MVVTGTTHGRGMPRPLVVDQVSQPRHLALDRLEAVALQLEGVGVDALAAARERAAQTLEPLLHPGAPALEDAHAGLDVGLGEEREVHAEAVVLPRGGPALGHQALEPLLALGGEL